MQLERNKSLVLYPLAAVFSGLLCCLKEIWKTAVFTSNPCIYENGWPYALVKYSTNSHNKRLQYYHRLKFEKWNCVYHRIIEWPVISRKKHEAVSVVSRHRHCNANLSLEGAPFYKGLLAYA